MLYHVMTACHENVEMELEKLGHFLVCQCPRFDSFFISESGHTVLHSLYSKFKNIC